MNPKVRSMIATVLLALTVFALLQRRALVAERYVAIALQLPAIALMIWARLTFGMRSFHAAANPTAGGLVTAGPYGFCRHPIYAAVLLFTWAGVLGRGLRPTALDLALVIFATILTAVRIQAEEQMLRASIPEYAGYAVHTKRLIPFVF